MRHFLILLACSAILVSANPPPEKPRVVGVIGDAWVHGKAAKVGMEVTPGDTLRTGKESTLQVRTAQGSGFALNEKTKMTFSAALDSIRISVQTGGLINIVKPGTPWSVQTHTAVAAVRGTTFYVHEDSARAYYCTCQGHVHYETTKKGPLDYTTTSHQAFQFLPGSDSLRVAPLILHSDSTVNALRILLQ